MCALPHFGVHLFVFGGGSYPDHVPLYTGRSELSGPSFPFREHACLAVEGK